MPMPFRSIQSGKDVQITFLNHNEIVVLESRSKMFTVKASAGQLTPL